MAGKDELSLEEALQQFRLEYSLPLRRLATLLNEACISHYSSGCGIKRLTFDLFPASHYIDEFEKLLNCDRPLRTRMSNGYKDATPRGEYNPAQDFLSYMTRWSGFAVQAMYTEGDSPRGIAAAKAKLLMDELLARLGENKVGAVLKTTELGRIMRMIASHIDMRDKARGYQAQISQSQIDGQNNYLKALAAAQHGNPPPDEPSPQRAGHERLRFRRTAS